MVTVTLKKHFLPFIVISLAGVFLCYEFVLQISPSVMTEQLMHTFRINALVLGMVLSVYYYSYGSMQIFAGLSFDRLGARKTIAYAIFVCAIGTLLMSLAQSTIWIGIGRFLSGFGSAFAFVGMLFLGKRWFAAKWFFMIAGITELVGCLGAIFGQTPVAATVNYFGWRHTLLYLAIFGVIMSVCIWLIIRDNPNHVDAVPDKQHESFKTARQSIAYILKHRQLWAIGLYAMMIFAPIAAFAALWGVPFLITKVNLSNTTAGAATSMIWVSMGLGSPVVGWISEKLHNRKLLLWLCPAIGVVCTCLLIYQPHLSLVEVYILTFLFGIGTAGQALSFCVVSDIASPRVIGTAMGFNNLLIVASGAIFQPLVGGLIHYFGSDHIINGMYVYTVADYQKALFVLPLCYCISILICIFWLKETRCKAVYN